MEDQIKRFITWKDDLNCPFSVVYNGTDKTKPKISYRKGNADKEWTVDQVYDFWLREICKSES